MLEQTPFLISTLAAEGVNLTVERREPTARIPVPYFHYYVSNGILGMSGNVTSYARAVYLAAGLWRKEWPAYRLRESLRLARVMAADILYEEHMRKVVA